MKYISLFLIVFVSVSLAVPPASELKVHIWPEPKEMKSGDKTVYINHKSFKFETSCIGDDVRDAIKRYTELFFYSEAEVNDHDGIRLCKINVLNENASLVHGVDESYSLSVSEDNSPIIISANTQFGLYHALETLSQMIVYDYDERVYLITGAPYSISDSPAYPYRLLMIDTSRHFLPLRFLYKIIDSLTYNKLNVLHWHLTDHESWPIEIKSKPELWKSSFTKYERYSQVEIRKVIEYGRKRGIRVIAEIDTPGHASAFCTGYPEVCPSATCHSPLDPTKNATFEILESIWNELLNEKDGMFFDKYFHVGGDEVDMSCWNKADQIIEWKKEHNYTNKDVYKYMIDKVSELSLKYNKKPIVWEEVYNNFGKSMIKDTIVHVWLGNANKLKSIVNDGYYGILSGVNPWYLPQKYGWKKIYNVTIDENIDEDKRHLVLGGGNAMWGEWVDLSDFMFTVYPRTSAGAERLWTPKNKLDINKAENRLHWFRGLLHRRGIECEIVKADEGRITPPGPGSIYGQ